MDLDFSPYAVGGAYVRPDSFTRLDPQFATGVYGLTQAAHAAGIPLQITSAYRSPELQAQLYASAVERYGSPQAARRWVAPPGRSQHNYGTAVDFALNGSLIRDADSPAAQFIRNNAEQYGLSVPMDWEPWQVESIGSRDGSRPQATISTRNAPTNTQTTGVGMDDTPQQPSGELSRSQRMMLGFAALRDAGAALQGQNSNFFANTMGGFQQQAQAADDRAFRQMQFDESVRQFGVQQARAGGDDGTPSAVRTLEMRAEMAGLVPGTPEYQQFMLTGGNIGSSEAPQDPAAVVALLRRAEMAGLVPGTPEYQEFMRLGGVGPSSFNAIDLAARAAGFAPISEGGDGSYEEFVRTGGAADRAAAVVEGTAEGELTVQVQALERGMPVLQEFVQELRAVGDAAEYRYVDTVAANLARQQGEPLSEGAIARGRYTAMVDNQILPLLKVTFGAAFTAVEGERLRATLGDESLSPAEKNAQLDAFIEAKEREIRALGGEVPDEAPETPALVQPETTQRLRYNPETGLMEPVE